MALEDAKAQVDHALTREDLKGLSFENAFAGVTSFCRRKLTKDLAGVDLAVTGLPFDQAVTNRPGTRFGPRAVREASSLLPFEPPYGWAVDPLSDHALADYGDLAFDYADVPAFSVAAQAHVAGILEHSACLTLGGDHYISLPCLRAHAAKHGPLALVHFDAHTDTWPDDTGHRVDHGTMFYRAVKEGLVDVARSVQIGIRTVCEDRLGIAGIDAPEVHGKTPAEVARKIKGIVGETQVYLSFDIDCLDPAFAPGTGTPVPGGLSSAQALGILRGLAGITMVGGDLVEVSPPYDTTGATAIAGAQVALEMICLWASGPGAA